MSEALQTNFNDVEAEGRIMLIKNPLGNGSEYYGRFNRKMVNTRTLIARIQARKAGTNELNVQQIAGFLKEEALAALRNGEAVNVLDLGTFYITPKGKFNGTNFVTKDGSKPLQVKCTPSLLAQSTVENILITNISVSEGGIKIRRIFNKYTELEDGILSCGKEARITGPKLKIGGKDSGIFLCPINEEGEISQSQETWMQCTHITENTEKTLDFYIPDNVDTGKKYKILVRTAYAGKNKDDRKTLLQVLSGVVSIEN